MEERRDTVRLLKEFLMLAGAVVALLVGMKLLVVDPALKPIRGDVDELKTELGAVRDGLDAMAVQMNGLLARIDVNTEVLAGISSRQASPTGYTTDLETEMPGRPEAIP